VKPGRLPSPSTASSVQLALNGITSRMPPDTQCFHCGAGFRHPFTIRARGGMARPKRILRRACGSLRMERLDRMPLVDFCNQYSPRAQPRTVRSPARTLDTARPACAELGGEPPKGVEAPSATSTADSGWRSSVLTGANLAVRPRRICRAPTETSRARGRPALAARLLTPSRSKVGPRSFTPTRSARTPRVTKPQPSWEETQDRMTASPRRPAFVSKHEDGGLRGLRWPAFARPAVRTNKHHLLTQAAPARPERSTSLAYAGQYPGLGPLLPYLREEIRDRLHPRCLPSMSYQPNNPRLRLGRPFW